jgi:hypothetical protein
LGVQRTGSSEPLKVTFAGNLFFPGLQRKNKTACMVTAYILGTAAKPLVAYCVLVAVRAFHLLCHAVPPLSFLKIFTIAGILVHGNRCPEKSAPFFVRLSYPAA